MKRKFLVCVLAAAMTLTLCACGGKQTDNNPPASTPSSIDSDAHIEQVPTDPFTDTDHQEDAQSPANQGPADVSSTYAQQPDAPSSDSNEPEGLIILTIVNKLGGDKRLTISCIDPRTSDCKTISQFQFGYIGEYLYCAGNSLDISVYEGYYTTRREWFDDDYDRMVESQWNIASGEVHAGWLDADGEFFDVTETLGLQAKSDFDAPTKHYAVGFSEDGYFIYASLVGERGSAHWEYYHVPLDNLTADAVAPGILLPGAGEKYKSSNHDLRFSDWDSNSGKFLLNQSNKISCLCDDGGENRQLYVPGNSRLSWNGVFSPDGASAAFMSKPKDGGAVDIYTMPLTGGDPVKVPTEFTLAEQLYCEEGDGSMLIDWK